MRYLLLCLLAPLLLAEDLPLVKTVDRQPLAAQLIRVLDSLEMLGDPLPAADAKELRRLATTAPDVEQIQKILDRYCLIGININPESRVKVQQGAAKPELQEQGWRTFLIKVQNEAGVTAVLAVDSPNAGQIANRPPDNR